MERKKGSMSRNPGIFSKLSASVGRGLARLTQRSKRKTVAPKGIQRDWASAVRMAFTRTFTLSKPNAATRRMRAARQMQLMKQRLAAYRATISRRRYWLMVLAALAILTGSGIAAYKVWHHAQRLKDAVAMVNSAPISQADLSAEVIATGVDYKQLSAAARKQLLDHIIERRLLLEVADKLSITKDPRTSSLRARSDEMFLANLIVQRFAGTPPPPPSVDEARRYMAAHPTMFAERQTFVVDAISCALESAPAADDKAFATMDSAENYLTGAKIPYRRQVQTLDSADMPASVVTGLLSLKPGDLFVLPQGRMTMIGTVQRRLAANTPPEIQLEAAQAALSKQRVVSRVSNAIRELRTKADIRYTAH